MTELPTEHCDLVLKGGLTSGVVYPNAIVRLADKYRFKNIGGASAGAIAAAAAAAAEYARDTSSTRPGSGMSGIAALSTDFARGGVKRFFQPDPAFKRIFHMVFGLVALGHKAKGLKVAGVVLEHLPMLKFALILAVVLTLAGIVASIRVSIAWLTPGLFAAAVVFALGVSAAICSLRREVGGINDAGLGLCSGKTVAPNDANSGLTDWLYLLFQRLAGLDPATPLTFRMLKDRGITLEVMTTCLSMSRPFRMPLKTAVFNFHADEFRALFPNEVVKHMQQTALKSGQVTLPAEGLVYWPFPGAGATDDQRDTGLDLPVIVAVRMSLSFPLLFKAVPLYVIDYRVKGDGEGAPLPAGDRPFSRCWFSDGGIASNFPIHFFDNVLPKCPTFGVSLGAYNTKLLHPERIREAQADPTLGDWLRIVRPVKPGSGLLPTIAEINSIGGLLGSVLTSAKDWQDSMLSQLSGYRERIVTVNLTSDEGGINLDMDETKITRLSKLGSLAGDDLMNFELDEHRWRRFLVMQDRLKAFAWEFEEGWTGGSESMKDFVVRYADCDNRSFKGSNDVNVGHVVREIDDFVALAAKWRANPPKPLMVVPKPSCVMRVTPRDN